MPPKPNKPTSPPEPMSAASTAAHPAANPAANLGGTTPGSRLRHARETRGLTIVDIANALRIKPVFIDALESDRPDALPTATHARGFLRSYAQYLGVDLGAAVIPAAAAEPAPLTVPQSGQLAPAALPGWLPALLPLLLVVGGIVLLYLFWQWLQPAPHAPIAPPPAALLSVPQADTPAPAAMTETPAPAVAQAAPATPETPAPSTTSNLAPSQPVAVPAAPAQPAPVAKADATPQTPIEAAAEKPTVVKADTVVVRAVSDSWVQITDATGRQLYSKLMRAGESWRAPAQPGLRLSTGNAGGLVLVRNGEADAPLGAHAQVLKNYTLTGGAMPAAAKPKVQVKPATSAADTLPADDEPPLDGED